MAGGVKWPPPPFAVPDKSGWYKSSIYLSKSLFIIIIIIIIIIIYLNEVSFVIARTNLWKNIKTLPLVVSVNINKT